MDVKVYMDLFLHGIEWIMFHGYLDYFPKPLLGGRPNTKPGDHGALNAHHPWLILLYHVWGLAWIEIHRNSIWLRAWSHTISHYTWGSMTTTWFWRCLGTDFGHFLLGSQFHAHGSWLMCEVALNMILYSWYLEVPSYNQHLCPYNYKTINQKDQVDFVLRDG